MYVTILVAVWNIPLSSGFLKSNLRISEPLNNCIKSPAVTIGPIPNSTSVPCCDAKITLANARKSNCGAVAPNNGVCPITM